MAVWSEKVREHRRNVCDNPNAPDNMSVRLALLKRIDAGEITLADAQKQVRKLRKQREKMQREGKLS